MPRDDAGAVLAPQPLSLLLRERRLKILSRAAKRAAASRRRFSQARLQEAEAILATVINGGDMLGEVTVKDASPFGPEPGVALMVTMTMYQFRRLCRYGAELEDDEDTNDAEPTDADHGEPPLGWSECVAQRTDIGTDELKSSLGSPDAIMDQRRWHEARYPADMFDRSHDLEADPSYSEPSLGAPETHIVAEGPRDTEGNGGVGSVVLVSGQQVWAEGDTRDLEAEPNGQ